MPDTNTNEPTTTPAVDTERKRKSCTDCTKCIVCKQKFYTAENGGRKQTPPAPPPSRVSDTTDLSVCDKCHGLKRKCEHYLKRDAENLEADEVCSRCLSSNSSIKETKCPPRTSDVVNAEQKNEDYRPGCKKPKTPPDAKEIAEDSDDRMAIWFPSHIDKDPAKHPLIPYPHPAPHVELRAGQFMNMCLCLKRNGLQSECPQSGCQGDQACMQHLLPSCVPSGLGLPTPKDKYFQRAEQPECYSKTELGKAYDKVMMETKTGGTGGLEEGRDSKVVVDKGEVSAPTTTVPKRAPRTLASQITISDQVEEKVAVHIRPNSPPNYISEPPVNPPYYPPCRRHKRYGVPGSEKYRNYGKKSKVSFKCKN